MDYNKGMRRLIRSFIFVAILLFVGYLFGVKELKFYKIISSSMEPTLLVGDRVMAVKPDNLVRKNIVVIKDPENGKDILAKRIIGLPGEKVDIRGGYVYINGKRIEEPYIKEKPFYTLSLKIPQNSYFLLGDNRNKSKDSSVWGPVKEELIVGKVICCYWPFKRFKIFITKK